MKKILLLIMTLCYLPILINYGQVLPVQKGLQAITAEAIKAQLGFLASDWTEGREAGERGEYLAADYIASMLQVYGVKPGGDYIHRTGYNSSFREPERSYFQNFILLKSTPGDEQILKFIKTVGKTKKAVNLSYNVDFIIRPSGQGIELEAPVVFAGYGYRNDKLFYNDFNKLDVRGKYILRIAGLPKFLRDTLSQKQVDFYRRGMESTYKSLGAIGIIEFNPEETVVGRPEQKDFMQMSPSEGVANPGKPYSRLSLPGKSTPDNLVRIVVSAKAANEILNGTGIDIEEYLKKADLNQSVILPSIYNRSIYLKTTVNTSQIAVRNVLGIIEGTDPERIIVLGAHYDHVGMGNGYIWNGADDNGSGTVAVMTIAKAIAATGIKPESTIIVALWTAEEKGLLGSRYFIDNPNYPKENLLLNVNFDMISRYISEDEPMKVTMTYSSSLNGIQEMTLSNLSRYGIDLSVDFQPSDDPPGGTDHRSFVKAGIPIIRFKPGHRKEYHTPFDETGITDWDIMEKIIKISFSDIWELANSSW